MPTHSFDAVRFALAWTRGAKSVEAHETEVDIEDRVVPATLFLPPGRQRDLSGWVVLHGITRPGRSHPELQRFARALASTGAAILVPEVPEWRDLRLAPERSLPTIRGAAEALDARPETRPGGVGLVGFSFGASQAVVASTDPSLEGLVSGVVGFGGYLDLWRTIPFFFTGEHEWQGEAHYNRPDPYGRWLVGANYLTDIPEYADCQDVSAGLWRLAAAAGDDGRVAWDPVYDSMKRDVRSQLPGPHRPIFDLYAPPSADEPPGEECQEMVDRLCDALDRASPRLHPRPYLDAVDVPIRLVHGKGDNLIPFTETLRFQEALPAHADVRADITALFAHSSESGVGSALSFAREGARFLGILRGVLGVAAAG